MADIVIFMGASGLASRESRLARTGAAVHRGVPGPEGAAAVGRDVRDPAAGGPGVAAELRRSWSWAGRGTRRGGRQTSKLFARGSATDSILRTTERYLHTLPDADETALDALCKVRGRSLECGNGVATDWTGKFFVRHKSMPRMCRGIPPWLPRGLDSAISVDLGGQTGSCHIPPVARSIRHGT